MTFKDLQRLIGSQSDVNFSSNNPKQILLLKLKNKPFWIWDSTTHKDKARTRGSIVAFNHIIGHPRKDGTEKPFFDYEKIVIPDTDGPLHTLTVKPVFPCLLYNFKIKHLWVRKPTGLGVTEFMLRLYGLVMPSQ